MKHVIVNANDIVPVSTICRVFNISKKTFSKMSQRQRVYLINTYYNMINNR